MRVRALLLRGLLVALAAAGAGCRAAPERPSRIVLLLVDTLRRDHVSAYGSATATPHIDRLAARGVVYRNAVSSFHQTTMSMASLFTGRTPSLESGDPADPLPWTGRSWCGMARFAARDAEDTCIPGSLDTLAERLRAAGYWTLGVVSNKLLFRPYGYDQGFDVWIEVGPPPEEAPALSNREQGELRTAEHVNRAVRQALERRPGERFFLYVHYLDVHDWLMHEASYADAVRSLDGAIGALLGHLEREGLLEDALVVLTSDHGEALGEEHLDFEPRTHFGNPSFEQVLLVPLIAAPALPAEPNRLVRSQDLAALIAGAVGLPARDGADLRPDELFLTEAIFRTYRRGRWKSLWPRDGGAVVLFDLVADPGETRNVAGAHPEVVESHRRRIAELSEALATRIAFDAVPTDEDRERLRALGYLE